MTRFRRSGLNWEGRRWIVSGPIDLLATIVEAAWPARHPADGTVASQGHDAGSPRSDHRPRPTTGPGIVRAIDVGEVVEDQGAELAEALRASRDPRIRYVIHEKRLFSSYDHSAGPAWEWRLYRGGNEHLNHVHLSTWANGDNDTTPWDITLSTDTDGTTTGDVDMEKLEAMVKDIQEELIDAGYPLPQWGADGKWGPETRNAYGLMVQDAARAREALAVGTEFDARITGVIVSDT